MTRRRAQHRQCEIERDHVRFRKARRERARAETGTAAGVEHARGFELDTFEPFDQPRADFRLQHRVRFVRRRGAAERVAHVAHVEPGAHAGTSAAKLRIAVASSSAWPRNGAWPLLHSR